MTRLRLLARDIRHMISHDQRLKVLQQIEAEKQKKIEEAEAEEKRLAAEKLKKAAEEA